MTFCLLLLAALPAPAGLPRAEARFLPAFAGGDGTLLAGLEITLTPGWHTYWRVPGESGLPPRLDWSGSRNLAAIRPLWPAPELIVTGGLRSLGFTGGLVLPLELRPIDPARPVELHLTAEIGVCEEICVPVTLAVAGRLPVVATPPPRLRAALARLPRIRDGRRAGMRCAARRAGGALELALTLPDPGLGPNPLAVVEVPDPAAWVELPELTRKAGRLHVETQVWPGQGGTVAFERGKVRLTLVAPEGALTLIGCAGE